MVSSTVSFISKNLPFNQYLPTATAQNTFDILAGLLN